MNIKVKVASSNIEVYFAMAIIIVSNKLIELKKVINKIYQTK